MESELLRFPDQFLWGTSTAAFQVEGQSAPSNWSIWEQDPTHIAQGQRSGRACDWWGGRWREDLDRAAGAGQNAHRTSVEWSRLQPAEGKWDEGALGYYRSLIAGIRERGMVPFITLHHFTEPLWLTERGGWECKEAPTLFAAYVAKVVEALKDQVSLWATINEPNVFAYGGYLSGETPPGVRDTKRAFRVMENLVRAHAAAYHAIHAIQPQAQVCITIYYRGFAPARPWLPTDRIAALLQHRLFDDLFPRALTDGVVNFVGSKVSIPEAKQTQDLIAIDYYTTDHVAFAPRAASNAFGRNFFPEGSVVSDTGLIAYEPEGIYEAVRWAKRFRLPVVIAENGVEDGDDHLRPRYLAEHLYQLWRALRLGVKVEGYFHWTLVDNFEWERGWTSRFGLWSLDVDTQERRKRPSADLYESICRDNGLAPRTLEQFAPEATAAKNQK